ncbi:MAG: helix-turn-helix domain-containing protein [Candidatus Izemoplasmataceae bacterium]
MAEMYPKQFLKSLGPLFRDYRKKSGYSVRDIARSANVAHTIVFDIENRKIIPNPETLEDLFNTLGIPLYKDPVTLWPLKDTLDAFFQVFYTKQLHEMTMYFDSLKRGEEILLHSPLRIEYLFSRALHSLVIKNENVDTTIEWLESLKDCYTERQNQALILIKGMNAYNKKHYDKAFDFFIKGEDENASFNMNHLTYYYLAFTADKLFKKELSLYYARIASDKYSNANNFQRKIDLDLLLAKNMIEVGNYQTAENYLNSIRFAVTNSDSEESDRQWLLNLRSYLSYVRGDYEHASELLKDSKEDNIVSTLLKAFIGYRTHRYEDAKAHLRKMRTFKGVHYETYRNCALVFLEHLDEEVNTDELQKALDYVLNHPYDLETIHARSFFTALVIEYYEDKGQCKKALDIAKTWIHRHTTNYTSETK